MAIVYSEQSVLCEGLLRYAAAALRRGEGVIVIAVPTRIEVLINGLQGEGFDVEALREGQQLRFFNANEVLEQIMPGRELSRPAFLSIIRPEIVAAQQRFGGVAAYGELVNILCQQGRPDDAHLLENWWNELIDELHFPLLCGYSGNVFDESMQDTLNRICDTHSHLLPGVDVQRFEHAVNAAFTAVLPSGDVGEMRRHLSSRRRHPTLMPDAQAELLTLQDLVPPVAQEVRLKAREHYYRRQQQSEEI